MGRFYRVGLAIMLTLGSAAVADDRDKKTTITISSPLEVPGKVLLPGTYVLRLLDSSSNRHIVEVTNEDQDRVLALTMAIGIQRANPAEKTILTFYEGARGVPLALRTWFYPGDILGQEFLYPHRQAVRISEAARVRVPETPGRTPEPSAPAPPKLGLKSPQEVSPLTPVGESGTKRQSSSHVPKSPDTTVYAASSPATKSTEQSSRRWAGVWIAVLVLFGAIILAFALGARVYTRRRRAA